MHWLLFPCLAYGNISISFLTLFRCYFLWLLVVMPLQAAWLSQVWAFAFPTCIILEVSHNICLRSLNTTQPGGKRKSLWCLFPGYLSLKIRFPNSWPLFITGGPGSQEVPGCSSLEHWSGCQTGESTLTQHLGLTISQTLITFTNPQWISKSYYS